MSETLSIDPGRRHHPSFTAWGDRGNTLRDSYSATDRASTKDYLYAPFASCRKNTLWGSSRPNERMRFDVVDSSRVVSHWGLGPPEGGLLRPLPKLRRRRKGSKPIPAQSQRNGIHWLIWSQVRADKSAPTPESTLINVFLERESSQKVIDYIYKWNC